MIFRLLCRTPVYKLQQNRVQLVRIDPIDFPSTIKVAGLFLGGHKTSVAINTSTSRIL